MDKNVYTSSLHEDDGPAFSHMGSGLDTEFGAALRSHRQQRLRRVLVNALCAATAACVTVWVCRRPEGSPAPQTTKAAALAAARQNPARALAA